MESGNILNIEKLRDDNLRTWKQKVRLILSYGDLEYYINISFTVPSDPDEAKERGRQDLKTQAIIGLSLSDQYLSHVSGVSRAQKMWKSILDLFESHTLLNMLRSRRNFYTVQMKCDENEFKLLNRIRHLVATL